MTIKRSLKEKIVFVAIIYWTTIITFRTFIFVKFRLRGFGPDFYFRNIHIHHFFFGFLLLFAFFCLVLNKRGDNLFSIILLGIGLALIFDELTFWTTFNFNNYWSIGNFLAVIIVGILLLIPVIFITKKTEKIKKVAINSLHKNPKNPFISLVIPAFNEEKFLPQTLSSVLAQSYKDFELIVVDNNSIDKTAEVAEEFGAKVLFEKNQGVGFARQTGFMQGKGSIVATTDADVILPQDWLSRIVKEFKEDKKLAAFGGLYTLYSGSFVAKAIIAFLSYPAWCLDKIICGGWSLPGANLAVRKESFVKIGGFKTELKFCEDADLSQRIRRVGKVLLDHNFIVETSGRRYKDGLFYGLLFYIPNSIIRIFLKKRIDFVNLPTIRTENSFLKRFSFVPIMFSIVLLFSFSYILNPSISQAKTVESIESKIDSFDYHIKTDFQKFRHNLANPHKIIFNGTRLNFVK